MQNRIRILQKELKKENLDAFLITFPISQTYLTNFRFSSGAVLVLQDQAYLLTDSRYIEEAQNKARDCEVVLFQYMMETLKNLLKKHNVKTIVPEQAHMTLAEWSSLRQYIDNVTWIDSPVLDKALSQMRMFKDAEELEFLRQAQRITEGAFEEMLNFLKPGVSEKEAALAIEFYMKKHGSEGLSFELIVISGPRTSLPHGHPTDGVIRSGDFVTMDTGAVVNGMRADMTRTVAIGSVSDEQRLVYETVLAAQKNAIRLVKEGVACKDVDEAARSVIRNAGYGDYFGHSLGHGIGLEVHEEPRFSPRSEAIAQENMVITVEPGIYLPGKFGVRIEDMVRVTKNGCENLTKAEKSLIVL